MAYYPAFLDLQNRLVLLVGGGDVAARKLASLLEAGARVRLVAPRLCQECRSLVGPAVELRERGFEPGDFEGAQLAVSATDNEAVNRQVADEAQRRGVFVNVVDVPPLCSFIVPAVVRRGELALAIATGGAAPALSRRIRQRLEKEFGPEWEPYLTLMRTLRKMILERKRPSAENRPYFEKLAEAPLLDYIRERDIIRLEAALRAILGEDFSLDTLGLNHLMDRENGA